VTPQARRAQAFAETYFAGCFAHRREAHDTFEALEQIARRVLLAVTPDIQLGAMLDRSGPGPDLEDSLDSVEHALALEEELRDPALLPEALDVARAAEVLRILLGPVAAHTTWDPETVWLRSLRGIVNERVRHRGGCTCAEAEGNVRTTVTRVH
jgi:hypothetical protein